MKQHFTKTEFLDVWRELKGYVPLRNDATVVRTDGIDLDLALTAGMDDWYARLLREGEERYLAPEDLSGVVSIPVPAGGGVTLQLPEGTVRVLHVKLSGWLAEARVVTDPSGAVALRQLHPFTRTCGERPVAVLHPGGELALYPASGTDELERLVCVVEREGVYAMDSSALNLIQKSE